MDTPETSRARSTEEVPDSSDRNEPVTETSIRRLRNALNSSAQANNSSLERLQRYRRLLMERSERERTEENGVQQSLQNLREALNATAENNNSCLERLQQLRERLQAHTAKLFANSNSRNTRLERLRNALNVEIEALNNMEVQFTNTSSRIERLRDEFNIYRRHQRNRQLVADPSEITMSAAEIFAMTNQRAEPQVPSNVPGPQEDDIFSDNLLLPDTASQDPPESSQNSAENSARQNRRSNVRPNRRRLYSPDLVSHDEGPPRLRRRREGRGVWHPRYNTHTRTWMEIHGDSSQSSDEGYQATSSPAASNFTVSSRSAFQPSVPRLSNSQVNANEGRNEEANSELNRNNEQSNDSVNNELNEFNIRNNRSLRIIRSTQEISQNLRRVLDSFHGNLDIEQVGERNPQPEENETAREQSENGYWLLEENSNSDSNHEEPAPNVNPNANRRWTSRWISLVPLRGVDGDGLPDPARSADATEQPGTRLRTLSENFEQSRNRDQLSPFSVNSTRYEQPPLFPFRSLRENLTRRLELSQNSGTTESPGQAASESQEVVDMPAGIASEHTIEVSSNSEAAQENTSNVPISGEREGSLDLEGDLYDPRSVSANNSANTDDRGTDGSREEEGWRGWRVCPRRQNQGQNDALGVRQGIQLLSRHIDNMQRLCRARLEIVQLQQVRRMWEDLQRQIRSLHVTVRVEMQNEAQSQPGPSGSGNGSRSASAPSTSTQNQPSGSGNGVELQSETAKNFKKAILENYKREKNETERAETDHSQPSTSRGINPTAAKKSKTENDNDATRISLSNLLPSESELRLLNIDPHGLSDILGNLYSPNSQASNDSLNLNVDSQSSSVPNNDHTYSNLATETGSTQLPSISSLVSNIASSLNLPPITSVVTSASNTFAESNVPLPSISNLVYANAGPSTSNQSENSNSGTSPESPTINTNPRGRQYTYQRVWRYGRRMYLRRPRLLTLGPRSMKRGSRAQASNNPFRHYENTRRPWQLRRNTGSRSIDRNREQTTTESLQAMIVRLESLVQQQRALARNSNALNRGSDSDSQPENPRENNDNQEMEQTREVTRLRARQVLSLMVESLTQFFEENRPGNGSHSNVLYEQIYKMYVLLHLALELTDLLLAQLVTTRRELESSQYGPFSSDLSAPSGSRSGEARNSSVDNSLQTENRSSTTRSTGPERRKTLNFLRRNSDSAAVVGETAGPSQESAEDLLSNYASRHLHNMAEGLKRLFNISLRDAMSSRNETADSQGQSTSNEPDTQRNNLSAENALSAEVQSIVERIQNTGTIDDGENEDQRLRGGAPTAATQQETNNNATNNIPTEGEPRNQRTNPGGRRMLSYRYSRPSRTLLNLGRSLVSYPSLRISASSARQGPTRNSPLRRERLISEPNYGNFGGSTAHSRDGGVSRQEFNVPVVQVNNVPVSDFSGAQTNPRRRQNTPPTPPHTPPPYLINSYLNSRERGGTSQHNDFNEQPGPSSVQPGNSRNQVITATGTARD